MLQARNKYDAVIFFHPELTIMYDFLNMTGLMINLFLICGSADDRLCNCVVCKTIGA